MLSRSGSSIISKTFLDNLGNNPEIILRYIHFLSLLSKALPGLGNKPRDLLVFHSFSYTFVLSCMTPQYFQKLFLSSLGNKPEIILLYILFLSLLSRAFSQAGEWTSGSSCFSQIFLHSYAEWFQQSYKNIFCSDRGVNSGSFLFFSHFAAPQTCKKSAQAEKWTQRLYF